MTKNVAECDNGVTGSIDVDMSSESSSILIDLDNFLPLTVSTDTLNFTIIDPEQEDIQQEESSDQIDDDSKGPQEQTDNHLDNNALNGRQEETGERVNDDEDTNRLQEKNSDQLDDDVVESSKKDTRLALFKYQLSQRPSGNVKPIKKAPSNAAAFLCDAQTKRVEALRDRNQLEFQRLQNETMEIELQKSKLKFEERMYDEQLGKNTTIQEEEMKMKEKEMQGKIDLRKQRFEYKLKKLALKEKEKEDEFQLKVKEIEKAERLEVNKMELEYKLKLDLEIAKLKEKP